MYLQSLFHSQVIYEVPRESNRNLVFKIKKVPRFLNCTCHQVKATWLSPQYLPLPLTSEIKHTLYNLMRSYSQLLNIKPLGKSQKTCLYTLRVHILSFLKVKSRSVIFNSLRPHGLYSPRNSQARILRPSLLQRIFPTQGSNQVSRIAGGFFTSRATREVLPFYRCVIF